MSIYRSYSEKKSRGYYKKFRPWFFLLIAIIAGTISVFALRHNNEQMVVLRNAVYAADENGDPDKLQQSLYELRSFILNHMNTSLTSGPNAVHPPIQLKYTYEREQAKRQRSLGAGQSNIYHDAQQACAAQNRSNTGSEAIACINEFVAARGIALNEINPSLYKFDFVSATWSPDLAGWSLVTAGASVILFLVTSVKQWLWRKTGQDKVNPLLKS